MNQNLLEMWKGAECLTGYSAVLEVRGSYTDQYINLELGENWRILSQSMLQPDEWSNVWFVQDLKVFLKLAEYITFSG